jgi:hypothetical protein
MENTTSLIPEYSEAPTFKQNAATNHEWLETAKWAKFFAIYGFIYLGITTLGILYMVFTLLPLMLSGMFNLPPIMAFGFGIIFLMVAAGMVAIYFGSIRHLHFAKNIRSALTNNNQEQLSAAWMYMKGAWKVYGIYTIIMLSIYFSLLTVMGYTMRNLQNMGGY